MAKEPGKTLQTAKLFQLGETNRTTRDSLNTSDSIDLWKFNNRVKSSFNLTLDSIAKRANADITLLNAKGRVIQTSALRGNRSEKLTNIPLEAGTFYVQVKLQRRSPGTRYALTLSAKPTASVPNSNDGTTDQFGNTFAAATQLRSATGSLKDFVGNSDPNDFLKFGALVAGQLKVELTGLSNNANLELYDSNQTLIVRSNNAGTANEQLNQSLTSIAGSTYYLRVTATPGQETSYTLNYSFTPDQVTRTASGLQYIDIKTGTGATPTLGQTVEVDYTGILLDGTKFDSSRDRNQSFSFPIGRGRVIQGWDEGISTMQVGGRRQLIIPAALAYGANGVEGAIPPNATLIFDVEVKKIS
ncbi:FKBP-type peptidyl-prolyl cis-trans isomerase [Phormidium tenue FACHB-886]|nr:FKBP-type peptidyl-prolyl cis-trans isomerase [Phormidium tenue FACHB-886]